jgi:hypothetical protein
MEDFILANSLELLESKEIIGDKETYNAYDWMADIYADRRAFDKAWNVILTAKEGLSSKSDYIKAKFYDMRAGFYDSRLDGEYQCDNKFKDRKALLADIEKAIKYMSKAKTADSGMKLAESYISKANVLIRSFPEQEKTIMSALEKARQLCLSETQEYSSIRRDYYMACGWYYTYVQENASNCKHVIKKAQEIENRIHESDLESMNNVKVPAANMLLELDLVKESVAMLQECIGICEADKNKDLSCYLRMKYNLLLYLLDCYERMKDKVKRRETIKAIEEMNRKYADRGIQ